MVRKYVQPRKGSREWEMDRVAHLNCGYCGHREENHVRTGKKEVLGGRVLHEVKCKFCKCKKFTG